MLVAAEATSTGHQSLDSLSAGIIASNAAIGREEEEDVDFIFDQLDDPGKNLFNNPCWASGSGYDFSICCDVEVHGPGGNAGCWDQVFSWKICCEEETWLRRESRKERDIRDKERADKAKDPGNNHGGSSPDGFGSGTSTFIPLWLDSTLKTVLGFSSGGMVERHGTNGSVLTDVGLRGGKGRFKMQSSLYLERVQKLNICIAKYEEYYPRLISFTGSRDQSYGDPFGCVAMNLRFFWSLLNGVLLGICVPTECEMEERAVSGPVVTMLAGKLMGVRWGCLKQEQELGLVTKFPAEFSPAPQTEADDAILEGCEVRSRRYFPTNDVVRLKLLISELRDEMAARSEELEVVGGSFIFDT